MGVDGNALYNDKHAQRRLLEVPSTWTSDWLIIIGVLWDYGTWVLEVAILGAT